MVGVGQLTIFSSFAGSASSPLEDTKWPRNPMRSVKSVDFSGEAVIP